MPKIRLLSPLILAIAVAGCDGSEELQASYAAPNAALWQPLQVKTDPVSGRRYELTWGAVRVYDAATSRPIGRIALPGAFGVAAHGVREPDLAIAPSGDLIVSSNIQPTIWRINASTLQVARQDIALQAEADRDFGFTRLHWSHDGQLYATSSISGSEWRIDLAQGTAEKLL